MAAWRVRAALILGLLFAVSSVAAADQQDARGTASQQVTSLPGEPEPPNWRWLIIEPVGRGGRVPIHTDAIEAEIVAGRWSPPQAGDKVRVSTDEERTWRDATPDEQGWIRHDALRGGYACLTVASDVERIMLLDASGHSMVYANGEPRVGDTYSTGWTLLPVCLLAGENTFLFRVGRGRVRAKLVEPDGAVLFNERDATLPDLLRGGTAGPEAVWGGVPVINATAEALTDLEIRCSVEGAAVVRTLLPVIPPLSTRKVGFRISSPGSIAGERAEARLGLFRVEDVHEEPLAMATLSLRVREPDDKHKRTFISEIDGSVQYYAVTPWRPGAQGAPSAPALFLTLHGAGVEATNQANAYEHKDWGHVVAPTNRRPFGFDWEDWGRLDAMEVFRIARARWETDPRRTYLTGHSMGGHGVWQVGATFPDQFAAIGPSAAWPDFWSYGGAATYDDPTPIEAMLLRAVSPSRTLALSRNYLHYGVYILHGERDDNVPVSLARMMREHLAGFHADFAYYERPGAGHWWGSACVDWPPMFDFFKHHTRPVPGTVREIEFHTASPGVSATARWLTIEAQLHALEPSSVTISLDAQARKFAGRTANVARLMLDLTELSAPRARETREGTVDATVLPAGDPLTVELDQQTLENIPWPQAEPRLWLRRDGETWLVISRPEPRRKGPHRYGPFKQAFRDRFMLVYGTRGTERQNALMYGKARYDAETFWYRGNGAVDVIPDVAFDPSQERDRNVILYGNADTNAAWAALLGESPVQVRRAAVTIGGRVIVGEDLACLFVRPRPGSRRALVGVVAGSGAVGLRLTERLPYFLSGVGYPDCLVLGPDVLSVGTAGVRAAGFFGHDWGVDSGEFAWRN
jgi:hypothetical protein